MKKSSLVSLCLSILTTGTLVTSTIATKSFAIPFLLSLDPSAINASAKEGTVRVNGQSPGSGVIFEKQGNIYYVLTAKHVVATPDEYEIITTDEAIYPLASEDIHPVADSDLAVAKFSSDQNYRVIPLGDSDKVTEGDPAFIAGWPQSGQAIPYIYQFISVNISGLSPRPLPGGYGLIYTGTARQGMSGGPVLNEEGSVVGIHGRAEGKEIYLPDSDFDTTIVRDGFSLAVPINTFLNNVPSMPDPPVATPVPPAVPRSYFSGPPRITGVRVTNDTQYRESEYRFNISIPENAGESLEEVVFSQVEGRDYPSFSIRETYAYVQGDRSTKLSLGLVANDTDEKTMTVVFDPPIPPGKEITVALKAHRNPVDGIYLYEATAFPPGNNGQGQRLGIERLSFYDPATIF
ncbi:MAG: DUF2808 domain-containing protein [Cyanobacteria bacterium J06614_10]